ncbi:MAG: hypothetical protein JWQ96_1789 [Segetibacter sp.]|nr:hypothetical protein [Segetibacter sp.]
MLKIIFDWLEVWALLIPLFVVITRKNQPPILTPIITYVLLALIINSLANISWKYKNDYNFPIWYQTNTYFYSIHSIVRFFLLSWFFIRLNQPLLLTIKKVILILFIIFLIVNFSFEPFINYWYKDGKMESTISTRLLAVEAGMMLFYCLQYYFYILLQDQTEERTPDFWIVTGLAIFSFCSFPIYFFYQAILNNHRTFTLNIWLVQKICFLIFCIGVAYAFYISKVSTNAVSTSE